MNHNVAIQAPGVLAFDGTNGFLHDITKYTRYAFCFEVVADLTANAVLKVIAAPASSEDPNEPDEPYDVLVTPVCEPGATPELGRFTIPDGTRKGTLVSGTLRCYPDKFIGLAAVSGAANIRAVLVRTGPTRA